MMKNVGNFILGLVCMGFVGIALVMGATLVVFVFSIFIAILPSLILGGLIIWVVRAIAM
jgi:hypothetical protein